MAVAMITAAIENIRWFSADHCEAPAAHAARHGATEKVCAAVLGSVHAPDASSVGHVIVAPVDGVNLFPQFAGDDA